MDEQQLVIEKRLILSEPHIVVPPGYLQIPLGQLLHQAGLITSDQILSTLREQMLGNDQPMGKILAGKKLIKQSTVDFFVDKWPKYIKSPYIYRIGDYLREAKLLNDENIKEILLQQVELKAKFGEIAVHKGLIKPQTIDFFLHGLSSDLRNRNIPDMKTANILWIVDTTK